MVAVDLTLGCSLALPDPIEPVKMTLKGQDKADVYRQIHAEMIKFARANDILVCHVNYSQLWRNDNEVAAAQ